MVAVDELRDLFTGVPADSGGGWASTPSYNVGLAFEICRRTNSLTEYALRSVLFDSSTVDDIPQPALDAIGLGVQRYRTWRQTDEGRRR